MSLVAPPGYGKTTVLAQWAAREPRPVAWLTLDALDNDPVILVRYLVAALGRIGPVDPSIATGHAASRDRILGAAIPRLVSEVPLARTGTADPRRRAPPRGPDVPRRAHRAARPPATQPERRAGRPHRAGGAVRALSRRRAAPRDRPGSLALDVEETAALARASGASSTPMASSSCIGEPRAGRSGPISHRSPAGGPGVSAACRSPSRAATATSRPTSRPS